MRAGMDRETGRLLTGWDHCVQSIGVILTTRVGARVMRRDFGSRIRELQDLTGNPRTILEIYSATAEAIRRFEPGFRLKTMRLARVGADGVYVFDLAGVFYPRGHLGDYSVSEQKAASLGGNFTGWRRAA